MQDSEGGEAMSVFETKCAECGRRYTLTFSEGNPYYCPECDRARKERISASFEAIAAEFDKRKAVER